MTAKTHMAGGILLTSTMLLCSQSLGLETTPAADICCLAGGLFGSVFCDIDERRSYIGKILWPLSYLFLVIKSLFRILAFFFPRKSRIHKNLKTISFCAAHRGIMHWPSTAVLILFLNCLLVGLACLFFSTIILELFSLIFGMFLGVIAHLLYDFISGKIPLLAPFSMKRFGIMLVSSRGFLDIVLIRGLSIVGCIIVLNKYFSGGVQ